MTVFPRNRISGMIMPRSLSGGPAFAGPVIRPQTRPPRSMASDRNKSPGE
jgi:hypothetical protein